MQIDIFDALAHRLHALAQQQGSNVGELLQTLLNRFAPEVAPGSLADMAHNAREAALGSASPVDTAATSREILDREYGDYLKRRIEPKGKAFKSSTPV